MYIFFKKIYECDTLVVDKVLYMKNGWWPNIFDIKMLVKSCVIEIFFKFWGPFRICQLIWLIPFKEGPQSLEIISMLLILTIIFLSKPWFIQAPHFSCILLYLQLVWSGVNELMKDRCHIIRPSPILES